MPETTNPTLVRVYKYVPFDPGSLCILTEGTLKYTNPVHFNDPFDCLPSYNASLSEVRKRSTPAIDRVIELTSPKPLPPAQRLIERRRHARILQQKIGSDDWNKSLLEQVGVVSLSRIPDSILMWSHYADFHRGFVVCFDVTYEGVDPTDTDAFGFHLIPHPVIYKEHRPRVNVGSDTDHEQLDKMILTKSTLWEYEKEERVIESARKPGIHPYNRDRILRSVIAGARMPQENRQQLQSVVNELNRVPALADLQLFQAEISDTEYKINIPGFDF